MTNPAKPQIVVSPRTQLHRAMGHDRENATINDNIAVEPR